MLPKAVFKRDCADFKVDEQLGFEPDGEGAHLWIQLRKTDCNTMDVVSGLAAMLNVAVRDVGYSGLKDRYAVTTQWMSVPFPINESLPEISSISSSLSSGVEILRLMKSGKKLRRGAHRKNEFTITLRDIEAQQDTVNKHLDNLAVTGFPNYFGPQRFGKFGRNVDNARDMFAAKKRKLSRFKRSMYLSAARSYLFNRVLAERVLQSNWLQVLPGEVCMLDGSQSVFKCETTDKPVDHDIFNEMQKRLDTHDIHTTGPLHGRGDGMTSGVVQAIERNCLQSEQLLCQGLESAGLTAERRALRAIAHDLQWNWIDDKTLELSFALQRGVYATSMLREIADIQSVETLT